MNIERNKNMRHEKKYCIDWSGKLFVHSCHCCLVFIWLQNNEGNKHRNNAWPPSRQYMHYLISTWQTELIDNDKKALAPFTNMIQL